MATPVVRISNADAPTERQQAVLMATKEARAYRDRKLVFPTPPQELHNQATALPYAEKVLQKRGIPVPSRQQCLGQLVLPFGQYSNALFHWLVVNDVGYLKYILDKHRAEVTNPPKGGVGNGWVKDYLTEYAESFPQISCVLEANIDRCVYGQKGFESHTFQEMWELYSQFQTVKDRPDQYNEQQRDTVVKATNSVRRWLNTPLTHILSLQMKRFRKYIKDKDQEQQPSTSRCDPPSWLEDDADLLAASQAEEDLLKSQGSTLEGETSSQSQCPESQSPETKHSEASTRWMAVIFPSCIAAAPHNG